jgi:hypothetical protein
MVLALPLAEFLADTNEFRLLAFGMKDISAPDAPYVVGTLYMGIVAFAAALLPFIMIFMYKNRLLQIRLCFVEMVLLIGLQIFIAIYIYRGSKSVDMFEISTTRLMITDVFPLVAAFFSFLAFKAIARDEAMVRSLDRIR